jgi:hypothetical protein
MKERLLHFIWQFQHFNKNELFTESGEPLQVIKQGFYNTNQGPDFSEATIKINQLVLVGNIELHINASDWYKHHHGGDTNYSNIILHVVWNNDKPVLDSFGKQLPTLALQNRVAKVLLLRYEELMNAGPAILCKKFLPALTDIGWLSWKERLVAERLEEKSKKVLQLYKESNHHWEETFWWMLSANFGIKVNTLVFETIAKTMPINILAKHKNQIHQLEALLLGQANLLNGFFVDDYPNMLKREYAFLQKKYDLKQTSIAPAFLRMRPAAFPTIRLSQLAMLIHTSSHLFSCCKQMEDINELKQKFDVVANDYWHYHYRFDEITDYKPKNLGKQMVDNIIINTVIPVLFAYGLHTKDEQYKEKAIRWLAELGPEHNSITKSWNGSGIANANALDSQALIQLTNHYCKEKSCLQCVVGNKLLKG